MREIGNFAAKQFTTTRVIDRLVKRVRADTDRRPAEVVLAEVDRVERRIPGLRAARENLGIGDRVIVQGELGYIILRVDDVLDALVFLVPRLGDEENVIVGAVDLAEGRDQARLVAVADVVLAAAGEICAIILRVQRHVRRVDIGPVLLFRQAEREDRTVSQ